MTLSPPAYPEWLESAKEIEALPDAEDWPPGSVALCQIQPKGKNVDELLREEAERGTMRGISLYSHLLDNVFLKISLNYLHL